MKEVGKIREKLFQIRGIAYLVQQKRLDEIPPLDIEDLNYGIGLTLLKSASTAMKLLNKLEARCARATNETTIDLRDRD